jgi:antitoxin HicB
VTGDPAARPADQPAEASYAMVLSHSQNGDGPAWIATVEELPGCTAQGPTPERAVAEARAAIDRWIRQAAADGREVPPPGAAAAHSGKLLVRMPRSLHGELVRASEREGTSLNAYIVAALAASVAWRRPGDAARAPAPGEPGATREAAPGEPGERAQPPARALSVALVVNLVVLGVAAMIALALLIAAWAA